MSETDIYKTKEGHNAKEQVVPRRRHREDLPTFDETINKDVSLTHRRRSKNTGFRRFLHQMKKPDYSKKFWTIAVCSIGSILLVLVVWDIFFRYPKQASGSPEPTFYRIEID